MTNITLHQGLELLRNRRTAARFSILTFVVVSALFALAEFARAGGALNLDEPGPLLLPAAIVSIGTLLAYLVSAIFVGMWIYRSHANLSAAGIDGLTFSPGWSVGWLFVPIANLFKPYQAMRELWNASHGTDDGYSAPAAQELTTWWSTFIIGNMLMNISTQFEEGAQAAQRTAAALDCLGIVILIACAFFLLRIIDRVTHAQQSICIGEAFA